MSRPHTSGSDRSTASSNSHAHASRLAPRRSDSSSSRCPPASSPNSRSRRSAPSTIAPPPPSLSSNATSPRSKTPSASCWPARPARSIATSRSTSSGHRASPPDSPRDLLQQRPDVLAAEQALIAANARIGAAVAEYYPRVSLTGILGVASDDLSNIAGVSAATYTLAAGLAGPIFTAGLIEGQVNAAKAADRQAIGTYRQTLLTAFREVEDALVTRTTTIAQGEAQSRQVDALETYNRLARLRYDNGYVGYLEVLDADRDRFDAQLEQVQLMASRISSEIAVYKAMGGGWVDAATEVADEERRARSSQDNASHSEPDPTPRTVR